MSKKAAPNAQVYLKPNREGPVHGGNPWIFSQAIARVEPDDTEAGSFAVIRNSTGDVLGAGYYHPKTTIAVRVLQWGDELDPPKLLIAKRMQRAHRLRQKMIPAATNCYRLINGDGDGLSGVVIDYYGGAFVVQFLTAGADRMRNDIVDNLRSLDARTIYERSHGSVRREEGLEDREGLLWGEPQTRIEVREDGRRVLIDLQHGQKTGYFLDQRENRRLFGSLADGTSLLDAYSYSGGFALAGLAGGARRAVAVDTSEKALEWGRRNLELNPELQIRATEGVELIHADVPKFLAQTSDRFDMISLDPPPLARSRKDVERAQHLYVTLNRLALTVLSPGGSLMTFSCSTHFRGADFVRAVQIAAAQAGRQMRIIRHLGAAADHPVLLGHAEGEYLSGLLLTEL